MISRIFAISKKVKEFIKFYKGNFAKKALSNDKAFDDGGAIDTRTYKGILCTQTTT